MGTDAVIRLGSFDLLGHVVRIRSSAPLAERLTAALADLSCGDRRRAPMLTVERFADGSWSVAWPEEQRYHGRDEAVAFSDVFGALNEAAARYATSIGRVSLHGGAVRIGAIGVAVVGHSGAGKSTLTAGLVQAGHGFIADELAAVSPAGADSKESPGAATVHPFHRPIGLRAGGAEALGVAIVDGPFKHTFPLSVATVGTLAGATPLGLVAFIERDPSASPQTTALSPARALHRLSNHTLGTWGMERKAFPQLEQLVRAVPAVVVRYGTIEEGVALIEQAVEASGSP